MRLCYFGFVDLCKYFLATHPGYYILPVRVNGSAVETLFSQLKDGSGGTLTGVSYASVRAKLITKRTVHGAHVGDPYRDAPLLLNRHRITY